MEFLHLGIIFIFGTIVGSFLNVVIYRLNTGFSISSGRSRCFACNKTLVWYELIPVLSFFVQKGRCRTCHSRISLQYPLVELATGILFTFSAYVTSFSLVTISTVSFLAFALYAMVSALLVVLFVYDLKHKILPSSVLYPFIIISFVCALILYGTGERGLLDVATGLILSLPIFLLWLFSKGRWIGFADGVLFLGVGFLLGFVLGVHAFLFAFWIGALVAIILTYLLPKKFGFKSEIPFGPFIILATLFFLFVQKDILGVLLLYDLF
jgi:prepilin signal peptidase PulO-like enzyme (type II secretory pathway)